MRTYAITLPGKASYIQAKSLSKAIEIYQKAHGYLPHEARVSCIMKP